MLDVFYPTQSFLELLELPPFFSAGSTPCSTKTQQEWTWVDPTIRWMPGWSKILLYSIPHALHNNISISLPTISTICALIDQHHKKTRDFKKKHQRSPFPFSAPAIGRLKLLHLQLHLGALDFFCLAFRRFVLTTWDRDGIGQLEAEFFVCKTLKHTVWIH